METVSRNTMDVVSAATSPSVGMGLDNIYSQYNCSTFASHANGQTMGSSMFHPYGFVSPNYGQPFHGHLQQHQHYVPQVTCYNGTTIPGSYTAASSFPSLPSNYGIPGGMFQNTLQSYTYPSLSLFNSNSTSSNSCSTSASGIGADTDMKKRREHPFILRRRFSGAPAEGMTRTRDNYRVVYTEKQRAGLEKAFKANKCIAAKKRTELSAELDLSERQIKIWYQNRRAKERRQTKTKKSSSVNDADVTTCADDHSNENKATHQQNIFSSCKFATNQQHSGIETETDDITNTEYQQQGQGHESIEMKTDYNRYPISPSDWNSSPSSGVFNSSTLPLSISPFSSNMEMDFMNRM